MIEVRPATNFARHFVKGLIFAYSLIFIDLLCIGQDTFIVTGQLRYCYTNTTLTNNFKNFKVLIDDIEPHYGISHKEIQVNESGEFTFDSLKASNYKFSTYLLNVSEIVVKVDKNITDVVLCVDNEFRPVPSDTLAVFTEKAKTDIRENNLKIYHLSPGLVIHKKNYNRSNERLKKKFGFRIETVSCLLVLDRQSFIEQEKYLAYNKVAEAYLDNKYGTAWRRKIK